MNGEQSDSYSSTEVSIILINYNTLHFTLKCIESIYKHSQGFTFEILLIDNASVNFTADHVIKLFPEIKIITNSENLGFAKANNQGITQSTGKYILLLNNDCELVENSIYRCLNLLGANPQIGVLSPMLNYPKGSPQHCVNAFPSITNEMLELFRLTKLMSPHQLSKRYKGRFYNYNESGKVPWVWATFFLFPKSLLSSLPDSKLSDEYFMYYEDVLWCYQIHQAGYQVYYYADTHVIHHLSQSTAITSSKKFDMIMENEWRFVKTYKGPLYAFLFFLIKSLLHLSQRSTHLRQLGIQYFKKAFH